MELSHIKKLKALEDGNSKLKKLLAETMREKQAIKAVLEKNDKPDSERRGHRDFQISSKLKKIL
jgi:hypothetical protein